MGIFFILTLFVLYLTNVVASAKTRAKARSFFWEDDKWKIRSLIPGYSCYRSVFRLVAQLLNTRINMNNCSVVKGSGTVLQVDYDLIYHMLESETDYGLWLWLYEGIARGRSLGCIEVESLLTPIKSS